MTIYSKNYKAIYTIVKTHIATFAEQQKRKKYGMALLRFSRDSIAFVPPRFALIKFRSPLISFVLFMCFFLF